MKADLIYIEAEHDEVPGIVRELAADEISATKITNDLLERGGRVYRQSMSVNIPLAYTHLEMEAALCVWEWLNEITVVPKRRAEADPVWLKYRELVGSVELRHYSIDVAKYVLPVYDLLPEWFRAIGSYDWEIIPAIVGEITPGEAFPDAKKARDAVLTTDWAKQEYLRQFEWNLHRHYGLADLEDAGLSKEDWLATWFNPDVDPEDQVKIYAEKHDLEKVR
ncbi:MAG: hypothetical protein J0H31_06435 [Alphaproteobacteria bacterium]|nr:hypothetical protein [Alphaproteobacteria bacterium]